MRRLGPDDAAFPILPPTDPSGLSSASGYPYPEVGISLRTYLAGQALIALGNKQMTAYPGDNVELSHFLRARYAVADADALIAALNAPIDGETP